MSAVPFTLKRSADLYTSGGGYDARCPADFPIERGEVWLAETLRRAWEDGAFTRTGWNTHPINLVRVYLFDAMTWARAPEAYAVLRDIARDPDVHVESGYFRDGWENDLRRDAARAMAGHRINGGMSHVEAVKAVEADLEGAPYIYEWRPPASGPPDLWP